MRAISTDNAEPVAFTISGGQVLRGISIGSGIDTVLLIHDVGADLDAWGGFPAELVTIDVRVIALDLPGHGLSDDPWVPDASLEQLRQVIYDLKRRNGKVFAVAVGELAPIVGMAGPDALIAISPQPSAAWDRERTGIPCLIFVGSADRAAADNAQRYFRNRSGWSVVSNFGVTENGTALLSTEWSGHIVEQSTAFLRDYRSAPGETSAPSM